MRNILTFDVEEYFQVSGFDSVAGRERMPSRVVPETEKVLGLLAEAGVRATFFVLGSTAERHPGLVRALAREGHEIASHGFHHELLYRRGPRAFRRDLRRGLRTLEGLLGAPVVGYRAPSFSIVRETLWALPILAEEGIVYDSSIVPIRHDRYGLRGAAATPGLVETSGGSLQELPPLTRRWLGGRFAAGGGGWFRLLPLWWTVSAVRRMNREGHPAVLYFHPWELDPDQPRVPGAGTAARFRHSVGLRKAERKLRRLLALFEFGSAAEHLGLPAQVAPRDSAIALPA